MLRRLLAAGLCGLVVVVGLWYGALWRTETSHLARERSQEAQAVAQVAQLDAQLAILRSEDKQLPADRAGLAKLDQEVPEGPSLDQLLDTINSAALSAGVVLSAVSTPEPAGWGSLPTPTATGAPAASSSAGAGPQSINLSVVAAGSETQLLRFVSLVDSQPRLFVVQSFALNSATDTASARGQGAGTNFSIKAFYVSSTTADPASSFALSTPKVGSKAVAQKVLAQETGIAAQADATNALVEEKAFFATAKGTYVSATSRQAVGVLGRGGLPWSDSAVPGTGQVTALAGTLGSAGRFLASRPGGRGPALVVESLSQSGTCFYVATYDAGASVVQAYAETSGGCALSVTLPRVARRGAAPEGAATPAASGVTKWYAAW